MNHQARFEPHDSDRSRQPRLMSPTRGLVVLNMVLLCGLGLVSLSPGADAQSSTSRARGEYTLVGGQSISGVSSVIYVLDSVNRELVALNWNDSTKSLEGVGYRDLRVDTSKDPDR